MKRNLDSLSQLQGYSSSESEDEAAASNNSVRLPLPSLPTFKVCRSIMREPASNVDSNGKVRNFPHEPGNWATYVHIPLTNVYLISDLAQQLLKSLLPIELHVAQDFHISLTKTVVLRHHLIKDFTKSVGEVLTGVTPFFISLSELKVYINEDRTRTFIGLKVREGKREVNEIVKSLDKCLLDYHLPTFYESPSFHASIAWCIGDRVKELNSKLTDLPNLSHFNFTQQVTYLKCTSGCKTFFYNFKSAPL